MIEDDMSPTLITSSDPEGIHATGLFEAAYNKAGLDAAGAQRLNERGGKLQSGIAKLIAELSAPDQCAGEEVLSDHGYRSSYRNPKSITEQCGILRRAFPGLGLADERLAERPAPTGAEGWFAIPRWQTIAPTYGGAVQRVLDAIKKARSGRFHNCREGQLGPDRLRQSAKTEKVFQTLGDEQKDHGILVVAAQFGLRHRGRSVRQALELMNVRGEFGLGAFAAGIMLLTHPERLMNSDDLWIDCAGDEFAPDANGGFSRAPVFLFYGGEIRFGANNWVDNADEDSGSASAFLPQ
jgi:hypothetical protein